MKLAEALARRADIQTRINEVRQRLVKSARVQEGEQPPEDPQELLGQLDQLIGELAPLVIRINRTNMTATLPGGQSLMEALAQRDALQLRYRTLDAVADAATETISRYSRSEIKTVATVNVSALRKQLDEIARQRRELDTRVQEANWTIDLLEA